jgi:hypothetical protein
MPRARPITTSFNAGELSPLLDGRVDQDKYFTGCKTLVNFIPTVQGPARRRGGTRYVGAVKDSAKRAWLADFVFSAGQAYVLEFGDNYLRFWVNRGQLLNGGVPYEIASPYTAADLATAEGTFALRTLQSSDVMWIVHAEGKYPPYKLSRLGATNWTLVQDDFTDGPFRDNNTNSSILMQANGVTGTVTVTSTSPVFQSGHVGSLLMLSSMDPGVVPPWNNGTNSTLTANVTQVRNAGNVYLALVSRAAGVFDDQKYPPTHTEGTATDGLIPFQYLHSGYGWGRILSVAGDGLSCTMSVISRLPDQVVSASTRRWAFSEFSSVYGWPTNVVFFKERLTYSRGRQVFHSFTGDFASFKRRDAGLVTSETAMSLTLAADKLDGIRWLAQSRTMLIGSARAELSLGEQTTQNVYSATNVQNVPQTEYGSRLLRPLRVGESVLFVERAGHRIRDMKFDFSIDRYKAEDVTVLSEHIFDGSEIVGDVEQEQRDIVDWAYQQQRDSIVWCVLSDGKLASMVFNRERGVIAWTPHDIGGNDAFVEAVQSIPAPDGRTDDTWFIVRRTVNGQVQRSVEYMTDYRLVKKGAAEAVHVDCSVTYRGVATNTITGLGHLEGETVSICIDGSNHTDKVVTGGAVTLDRPGELVHVGYRFVSRMQTMRLEVQGGGGTSQTARKGIGDCWLRLQSTIGGRVGPSFDRPMDEIRTLDPKAPVGTPPKLFNGDYKLQFPGGFDTDAYVCYEQRMPLPATIVSVILRVQIND